MGATIEKLEFPVRDVAAANPYSAAIDAALAAAMAETTTLPESLLRMDGMSGTKYRMFANNLVGSIPDARYLEIGIWRGSTLFAALSGNKMHATAIDNWSGFGGPRVSFMMNLQAMDSPDIVVTMVEADFRKVDYAEIGKHNIYFFDGPHEAADQRDAILLPQPALDDQFVLIVDDWNYPWVREETWKAMGEISLRLDHVVEIRTTDDGSHPDTFGPNSSWHNGYFIAACTKRAEG